jgi:hypothetical protein
MLTPGPNVRVFKPSLKRYIFKGDKNPEHYFLQRERKAVDPNVVIFHGIKKKTAEYERDTSPAKLTDISSKVSSNPLLGVSANICQRYLVDKTGMITTRRRTTDRKMAEVHRTIFMMPSSKSNQ